MHRFAFFDLDETLIRCKSLLGCHAVHAGASACLPDSDLRGGTGAVRQWLRDGIERGLDRADLNREFYRRHFAGVSIAALRMAAHTWHAALHRHGLYHDAACAALEYCRRLGYTPVIVTGSFREVVALLAAELHVAHFLCAPLAERNGHYTGLLDGVPMIGQGKRDAVARFLTTHDGDPAACLGFGDDISDAPFLAYLGRAYYCGPHPAAPPEWVKRQGLSVLADLDQESH